MNKSSTNENLQSVYHAEALGRLNLLPSAVAYGINVLHYEFPRTDFRSETVAQVRQAATPNASATNELPVKKSLHVPEEYISQIARDALDSAALQNEEREALAGQARNAVEDAFNEPVA